MGDLLLKNCAEIVYSSHGNPKKGADMSTIDVLTNHDILVCNGKIMTIQENINANGDIEVIDCSGKTVLPGFVDCHTHPVFDGDRSNEFSLKLAGASYMDIHKAGGGIHYTVQKTKEASEEKLIELLNGRLDQMIKHGTTTAEAKSGYGLEVDTEIKMLKVIKHALDNHCMNIQSTYLCAHAVPVGADPEQMTDEIVNEHIPKVAALDLDITNIDVFCEEGVYNAEQTTRMCEAGKEHGWVPNVHVEEIVYIGGAEAAVKYGARALSHLEKVSDEAIDLMAANEVSAVILPTTAYILKLVPPPVRKMIDAGVFVALASDYNPNAPCFSMPFVMHLACILCGMNMAEALNAATINAAHSIGLHGDRGSITTGKRADMVILDAPSWKHIIYQLGNHQNLIQSTIINGVVVNQAS